jgi:putative FmdB family regulatory protein
MPIYEYRCSSCGSDHEALQKLSEPLLVTCPHCHKDTLVKQVSAAGFHLKGSGWYVTDFRNGSKPAAAVPPKTESTGDGGAATTSDTPAKTSEAKGDAKSDTKSDTPAPAPAPATPKPTSSTE